MKTGILTLADLLALRDKTVAQVGEDKIIAAIQADIAKHNLITQDGVSQLCELTTEHTLLDALSVDGEMTRADEFSRVATELAEGEGVAVSFPLEKLHRAVGWTSEFFIQKSAADLAAQVLATQKAHVKAINKAFRTAVFTPTNRVVRDIHDTQLPLTVRAFANGDGQAIPEGEWLEEFGEDHNHYFAGSLAEKIDAVIGTVTEHHSNDVKLYISTANEAQVRELPGFLPYVDPRIVPSNAQDRAAGTLDITRTDNRAIGIYKNAEVYTKPWVPANYAFAFDAGSERKPLAFRQPRQTQLQGLRVVATNSMFPLHAQTMEARFGVGVRTRTNGAVLYFGGDEDYVVPSFR